MKLAGNSALVEERESVQMKYLKVRFAVYTLLLITVFAVTPLSNFGPVAFPLLMLLLVGSGSNLISFLWLSGRKGLTYHTCFVTFVDVVLITIAIHYTGGIESAFSWVYVVVLVAVTLAHGTRAGMYAAILSSILYSGLLFAEFSGAISHVQLRSIDAALVHTDRTYLYLKLLSTYALFFATAAVSGYLERRLLQGRNYLEKVIEERTSDLLKANEQLSEEINDRRKVEERLEKSVALTRATLESTPNGILVIDRQGNLQSYNQKFLEMWSIPKQIIRSSNDVEMPRHMLNQAKYPARVAESAKELFGHPEREHFNIVELSDGRIFEWCSKPQKIGDRTFGIVLTYRDISERKGAEELLRKSEQKYRTLFEESKDPIFISTPEGRILDINLAGVELFGYSSKEEFLHVDVGDTYMSAEGREKYQGLMAQQGFVKDLELVLRTRCADPINVLVTANALRDESGKIVAYRGTMRDITEQKQLQQQLFQAQKMESIGTLAGGIAHDFNNILGGILGYASLMKSKMQKDHPFSQYVDIIERSSLRAAELTSQLLGFARGGKYNVKPVEANKVIEETLKLVGRTLDKSIEIETHLSSVQTVVADGGQLQQMLMNLFINAADAMPAGGKLIVETRAERLTEEYVKTHVGAKAGSYISLSVTDTGTGMDKEVQKRIFEPFFTTKQEGKGTGLGLSMVYGVVKGHGGYITVYSEPGHGTTFKIYLPATDMPEQTESVQVRAPQGSNELILVVDDEEPIRSFTKAVLENNGYKVLLAENGGDAINIYKEHNGSINLVILDMIMPKAGGHETFLRLRAHDPRVRTLLSTGYSQSGKAQEILDSGVMGFLQKPYQANTLLTKVRDVLDE